MKVYIVDLTRLRKDYKEIDLELITDDEFKEVSSNCGYTLSERGFENAYNNDDFDHVNTFIRFIE